MMMMIMMMMTTTVVVTMIMRITLIIPIKINDILVLEKGEEKMPLILRNLLHIP